MYTRKDFDHQNAMHHDEAAICLQGREPDFEENLANLVAGSLAIIVAAEVRPPNFHLQQANSMDHRLPKAEPGLKHLSLALCVSSGTARISFLGSKFLPVCPQQAALQDVLSKSPTVLHIDNEGQCSTCWLLAESNVVAAGILEILQVSCTTVSAALARDPKAAGHTHCSSVQQSKRQALWAPDAVA